MSNTYKRDEASGALVNMNMPAYSARKLAKERTKTIAKQQAQIDSLLNEVNDLKEAIQQLLNK
jgi:cell division protein FtsL